MRGYEVVEDRPWEAFEEDELSRLLARQGGVISTRQALAFLTEKAIRHKVASGRWRRLHRGVMVAHTGVVGRRQHLWAAVLAVGGARPVALGGLSALGVRGLEGIGEHMIHVVVPQSRRLVAPGGVAVHRVSRFTWEDVDATTSPPSTLAGRSVVDAAQWARSDDQAMLVIAASFQQRLVRFVEIERLLEDKVNTTRRRLILETAQECEGGSHSLGELDFLRLCKRAGLPMPTRQYSWRDPRGRRRYTDAVFDQWMVAVEIEGVHHLNVNVAWDDAGRQNALGLAGYRVLRYPAWFVRRYPERVVADLRQALILAGWVPP